MPSPSFDDQESCNKPSESRSEILSNHVKTHPPPPLMKEEQIADNGSRQSLGSSEKCCQNTCSRKTTQARRRRTPHCRCEEHCRSQDEARSRPDCSCRWVISNFLSLATSLMSRGYWVQILPRGALLIASKRCFAFLNFTIAYIRFLRKYSERV